MEGSCVEESEEFAVALSCCVDGGTCFDSLLASACGIGFADVGGVATVGFCCPASFNGTVPGSGNAFCGRFCQGTGGISLPPPRCGGGSFAVP